MTCPPQAHPFFSTSGGNETVYERGQSMTTPFSCNECGRGWTGLKECHCASCHESFSTEANFDRHRVFRKTDDWNTRDCLSAVEMADLRTKSGVRVLEQSERKHGRVWVSAGSYIHEPSQAALL